MKLSYLLLLAPLMGCASTETTHVQDDAVAAVSDALPRPEVRYYVIADT